LQHGCSRSAPIRERPECETPALGSACKLTAIESDHDPDMTNANTASTAKTAVDGFLEALISGEGVPATLYAEGAVLDATVPSWRFEATGPEAISAEYATWFADPGRFEQLERRPTSDGEVVSYLLTWQEAGELHAAHHCHVITLADGLIARDVVWCGGRWGASLLAKMGATAHA
jgi:hypothetical protein